jgi:UTP--glucose-1-phosphate uridylyltransferase
MIVVVAAAGEGTRFYPLSRVVPKELFPLGDRPVLQHILEEAAAGGAREVVVVTSPRKPEIARYFLGAPSTPPVGANLAEKSLATLGRRLRLSFVEQPNPSGLAEAIACGARLVRGRSFGALVADTLHGTDPPVLAALQAAHRRLGRPGGVVAVRSVPRRDVLRYGVIDPGPRRLGCYRVRRVVEKPTPGEEPSRLALTGAYYFSPEIFRSIRRTRGLGSGVGHLAAALTDLAERERLYAWPLPVAPVDAGDLARWHAANRAWRPAAAPGAGGRSPGPGSRRRSRGPARPG